MDRMLLESDEETNFTLEYGNDLKLSTDTLNN
jgi:hypothetical protein